MADSSVTPRHGTDATYQNWMCRCSPCRAAHAAACRRYRERRAAQRRLDANGDLVAPGAA